MQIEWSDSYFIPQSVSCCTDPGIWRFLPNPHLSTLPNKEPYYEGQINFTPVGCFKTPKAQHPTYHIPPLVGIEDTFKLTYHAKPSYEWVSIWYSLHIILPPFFFNRNMYLFGKFHINCNISLFGIKRHPKRHFSLFFNMTHGHKDQLQPFFHFLIKCAKSLCCKKQRTKIYRSSRAWVILLVLNEHFVWNLLLE